ncbi:hypothetical protein B0A49_11882 [Cryomyces minteri]|uniref:GPI transamidase component GAB1 n=1 Tax=Cryomyces minteri TaxID=331657 RepID=A0A4U0VHQ5_9PEZI|nr:hypothetical protein B0A49_11882 [Cryomyces minteri]
MNLQLDRHKALLFGSAAAIRLLLFTGFPSLPDLLTGRVEISTPITSFKRLQEGLFLYTHNVSPYDGGVYHQAPLLLPLFSLLPNPSIYPLATDLLYTAIDLLSANALMQIAESRESVSSRLFTSPRKNARWSAVAVGAGYLFNPLALLTTLARPTSVLTDLFILLATSKACAGHALTSTFALAVASYLSLYPVLLFPPLALLCYDRILLRASHAGSSTNSNVTNNNNNNRKPPSLFVFVLAHLTRLALALTALLILSYLINGSWSFIPATYGTHLLLRDLTPTVGLWWYFFTEIFDSFRAFFLGVFWLHMASYSLGITVRVRGQPLFAVMALLGVLAVFKPYPSVGDTRLFLGALLLYGHVFELTRYAFPALSSLLYSTFLGPAFYYLWIYAGSGNANFFYAITLVWSLGLSVVLADVIHAVLRDEWEVERPEMKGREARQI